MGKYKMSFIIYRIDTFDYGSNSLGVGTRTENWYVRFDQMFDDEEEAKEYVRRKNRQVSSLPNWLISIPEADRPAFVDTFCFGNDLRWLAERRYFLGKVPERAIREAIRTSMGAIVVTQS